MKSYKRSIYSFHSLYSLLFVSFAIIFPINSFAQDRPGAQPLEATAAVWDLENLSKETLSNSTIMALTQHIRIKVFGVLPNYRWLERGRIKEVLDEQKFQASGCTDQSCAVEMGQLLGARKMVTGSLSKTGNTYNLTLSVIDIETGLVDKNASEVCPDCTEGQLYQLAEKTVLALSGRTSPQLKPVKPAYTGPLLHKGRINLDVNYPGSGLRYFFSDKMALELREQYSEQTTNDPIPGTNRYTKAFVLGMRLYHYPSISSRSLRPYFCIESDYIYFRSPYSKGSGGAYGLFGGIEYFLGRSVSVQTDIGAAYISITDKATALMDGGIEYVMNFGINIYFTK